MMRYRSNRELFCLVFIRSLLVVMVVSYWKDSDWHTWPWNSRNCVLSYLWRADRQTAQGRAGDQKDLVLWSVLNSSSDIPLKLFPLHKALSEIIVVSCNFMCETKAWVSQVWDLFSNLYTLWRAQNVPNFLSYTNVFCCGVHSQELP